MASETEPNGDFLCLYFTVFIVVVTSQLCLRTLALFIP